ncbi:MAG: FAD/NAD(P)-binding oxidoreductase [Spirochaetaceae bacterium]|nr:MAG: FAD/NAD(P)-binding oxidoreductase [Spirochaetaceae bacterium]
MNLSADLIIIGAGVVGAMTAWRARRSGLRIVVLEAANDVSMGSTKANSGIIHGGYAEKSGLRGQLCYPGRLMYPELDRALNFGFRTTGSMILAFTPDEAHGLEAILAQGQENGVDDLELLTGEQVRAMEPEVNPAVVAALWCRGAGIASPYELTIALMEQAVETGVRFVPSTRVVAIDPDSGADGGIQVICEQGASGRTVTFTAGHLVNAAGAGSGAISAMLGDGDVNLSFRKGEYLLFRKGSGERITSVLFQMPTALGKGILVTSTVHGNLMIGPDAQNDTDPEDTATDVSSLASIFHEARHSVPNIDPAHLIRTFSGVRAMDASGDFVIKPSSRYPRIIHAAGIQSPGLTAAPAIAELVLKQLKDAGLSVTCSWVDAPRRPIYGTRAVPTPELKERIALPKGHPERIVCRCEQVSESEILDSLQRGLPVTSPDAVKRRTRAGMGWCQGQFCRPRVVEYLRDHVLNDPCGILETEDVAHSGISRVRGDEFKKAIKGLE